jgi:hypothetical protein
MWQNRIVNLAVEDPEQLLAHPMNARTHPGAQRNAMRGVLDEIGWIAPVIVNDVTGTMIDGHMRCEEAISAGEHVPVLHVELTEEEELAMLALYDPIGMAARYDQELLSELADAVQVGDMALQTMLDQLQAAAPIADDSEDASVFGDETEFKSIVLIYSQDRYDEMLSLLASMPGSSPAEKVYKALMRQGTVGATD